MQSSLAIVNGNEWSAMVQVADALVQSGFLPQSIKNAQQAVAIILAGRELGIGPWQAVQTINVIQGKPTVSPQLMLALINQSGQLEDIAIDGDVKGCIVMMKRKGRAPHTETFTFEDAQKLGLAGKDNYRKQPAIMLRWRAVAACARIVFPDVILGLYTPDEMGADVEVGDDGAMSAIDVQPEPEKSTSIADAAERFKQNSAQHGGPTTREPQAQAEGEAAYTAYSVERIEFHTNGSGKLYSVLKAQSGDNIVIYSADVFRQAGVSDSEIQGWKDMGRWDFELPITVIARQFVNGKNNVNWDVQSVTMADFGQTADDAAFAAIPGAFS